MYITIIDADGSSVLLNLLDRDKTNKYYNILNSKDKLFISKITESQYSEYIESQEPIPLTLEQLKQQKLQELSIWDKSLEVNGMSFGNSTIWLKQGNRLSLTNTILNNRFDKMPESTIIPVTLGVVKTEIPMNILFDILKLIDRYAQKCYNQTGDYFIDISKSDSIDYINSITFTNNYEQINIENEIHLSNISHNNNITGDS